MRNRLVRFYRKIPYYCPFYDVLLISLFVLLLVSQTGFASGTPSTIHHGTPNSGTMTNSVQINSATGLWIKDQSPTLNWTGDTIRDSLYEIGVQWNVDYSNEPRIQINRISKEGGGALTGTSSHQNGLDIDIRYFRLDDEEGPLTLPSANYDQTLTEELINRIEDHDDLNITHIFVNDTDDLSGLDTNDFSIQVVSGHDDHIRLEDPDGTSN